MHSLSQGKLSIPKIWNAKNAKITGDKLVKSKKVIEELYDKMKTKTNAKHGYCCKCGWTL